MYSQPTLTCKLALIAYCYVKLPSTPYVLTHKVAVLFHKNNSSLT